MLRILVTFGRPDFDSDIIRQSNNQIHIFSAPGGMDWTVTYCGACDVDGITLDDEEARYSCCIASQRQLVSGFRPMVE